VTRPGDAPHLPAEGGAQVVEDLLRECAPQVLAALVRRHGRFDACEDAVQEAMLAAARQWPAGGVPDRPRAWLLTVAGRALVDGWRADSARRRREALVALDPAVRTPAGDAAPGLGSGADSWQASDLGPPDGTDGHDDTLTLLFLCCHPALSPPSQLALTLRAVGGLSTAQIAAAFLVPEATMAKRISRAKGAVRAAGGRFEPPEPAERDARLAVVRHVLYLLFTEGHVASDGPALHRPDLAAEAIRLTRLLHRLVHRVQPRDAETAGLLALMLLTDARREARTDADGALVPLAEQDRARWDTRRIAEGRALLHRTLGTGDVGQYQLQAAIAALHDEAPDAERTDWPQILALYDVLARVAPGPMVTLSRAVAVAMVHGPTAGLALVGTLDADDRATWRHRLDAVRGHLLELHGDTDAAREAYARAARTTASLPEQRYLQLRAARVGVGSGPSSRGRDMAVTFDGTVRRWREDREGGLAVVDVPDDLIAELGGRRQARVTGTLNDAGFTGSTMLVAGGGLCVGVSKAALKAAGAAVGDAVRVSIAPVER
jgi:predicted RNA polymerase sigma factor